jgi:ATP-dependent helicase STH1/SNF2
MVESELPAFYRRDMDADIARAAQEQEAEAEGRGRRAKNDVRYTDGLTDDQWLTAMDASDDDPDEAAERKRSKIDQRAERKRLNALLAEAEAQGKPLDAGKLLEENSVAAAPKSAKKRARPSMSATPSVMGDDGSAVSSSAGDGDDTDARNVARSNRPHRRRQTSSSCRSCLTRRMRSSRSWERISTSSSSKPSTRKSVARYTRQRPSADAQTFPDYYVIIKRPMTMNQIKKRIGKDTSFTLAAFRADMHQVWDNARTYNEEASWVYAAAEEMQEFFDKRWDEEMAKLIGGNGSADASAGPSAAPSGTSTPMFKPLEKVTMPKIKLNMGGGGSKRLENISPDPTPSESSDDGDDDY